MKKVNCLTGWNGIGKTNLLDAIYFLCLSKSNFQYIDNQLINFNSDQMSVRGIIEVNGNNERVKGLIKKGGKKEFYIDDQPLKRISDLVGRYPVVFISPADMFLITEGHEERRKLIDNILSQTYHPYLEQLMVYNRVLQQRNTLLKHFYETKSWNPSLLDALDFQLLKPAQDVYECRKKLMSNVLPDFLSFYQKISGGKEVPSLEYHSDLDIGDLEQLLRGSRDKDRLLQRTDCGIHKDEIEFLLDGRKLKKFGSQGQQKSYLLAFKLALYVYLSEKKDTKPVLILDDLFDRLDAQRCEYLMEIISKENIGQVFISDTSEQKIKDISQLISEKIDYFRLGI